MLDRFKEADIVTIGLLSDTHLPYRMRQLPNEILDIFRDVDFILHAGDVDRIEYLSDLVALAPLHAVRGNLHFTDLSDGGRDLPLELHLTIAGRNVVVNHGGWPHLLSQAGDWLVENLIKLGKDAMNSRMAHRLAQQYPHADVIIFGHSHRHYRAWHNGTLILNPGAVCPTTRETPSVGKLYLSPQAIEVEVISLA